MKFEPAIGNKTVFTGLPAMFEALMAKLEAADENYKSLNAKIDENAKSFNAKIDESVKSLNAKIDKMENKLQGITEVLGNLEIQVNEKLENAKQICDNVDGKVGEISKNVNSQIEEHLKTLSASNITKKKLQEMSNVLSTMQVQGNKQFQMIEQQFKEMSQCKKIIPVEQTYNVNLGFIGSENQKCHLETQFRNLIKKINENDGAKRKLNISSQLIDRERLEAHKRRFQNGVEFPARRGNDIVIVNYKHISYQGIEELFSTVPVPADFYSFISIIIKNAKWYKESNKEFDFSNPIDVEKK